MNKKTKRGERIEESNNVLGISGICDEFQFVQYVWAFFFLCNGTLNIYFKNEN